MELYTIMWLGLGVVLLGYWLYKKRKRK